MSAARRGNPYLTVRLPQETHDRLKEFAGGGEGGKAGGVALFVRRLIYRELGEPVPKQWGKDEATLNLYLDVSKDLDRWEAEGLELSPAVSLFKALREDVGTMTDPVIRNFVYVLLGRLSMMLMAKEALKLET